MPWYTLVIKISVIFHIPQDLNGYAPITLKWDKSKTSFIVSAKHECTRTR